MNEWACNPWSRQGNRRAERFVELNSKYMPCASFPHPNRLQQPRVIDERIIVLSAGALQEDYNPLMRRSKRTPTDPAFLEAVSTALQTYKATQGPTFTNEALAAALGVDESTIAKNIAKRNPINGEVLARACVDLGISISYKGRTISAGSGPTSTAIRDSQPKQLEFFFDAAYSATGEKNPWRITRRKAEPLEFNLRIRIAS